jgi:hypothetical protein
VCLAAAACGKSSDPPSAPKASFPSGIISSLAPQACSCQNDACTQVVERMMGEVTAQVEEYKKTQPLTPDQDKQLAELNDCVATMRSWEVRDLAAFGTVPFSFQGTLRVPRGAKTRTATVHDADGKQTGMMAYVDLPDGVKVMLIERSANSTDDPGMLKEMLASTGKVVLDRREASWYMLAIEREDGIAVQGATWGARPGLSCGTEQPITAAQIDEIVRICSSLQPKP